MRSYLKLFSGASEFEAHARRCIVKKVATELSLRERKKAQTRADLMHAAAALFAERGYENTNVDDIVERANYSRATFFRWFGTKEEVLFADVPEQLAEVDSRLRGSPDNDPLDVVRRVLTEMIVSYADPERAHIVQLWMSEPTLHRRYRLIYTDVEDVIARYLADAWEVDVEHSIEARVVASAMAGIGTAAARQTIAAPNPDPAAVRDALDQGFTLLEQGTLTLSGAQRASRGGSQLG